MLDKLTKQDIDNIIAKHNDGALLKDLAEEYQISATDLIKILTEPVVVESNIEDNTDVHEDDNTVEIMLPAGEEGLSISKPSNNDIFMDLIIYGLPLDEVCRKYNIPEGDVGIILEVIYMGLSDKVIPMDDIKEAIKKICAEVYLARFN